jgi:AraC family transcriptional regulator
VLYLPNAYQAEATVEFVADGRLQEIKFYPDDYRQGCFGILSASLVYKSCWDVPVEFTHLYLEPSFLAQIAPESINPDRVELTLETKRIDPLVYHIALALKASLEADSRGDRFYADSLSTALSAHLIQHYATRRHSFKDYDDGLPPQKLKQAFEYIDAHLGENLSLSEIANELDMSQYYFSRLFKQSVGITPHQYLLHHRVERAKQLLRHSEQTVTAIALTCGFAQQSHFAKRFREHTGLTPSQFRKL